MRHMLDYAVEAHALAEAHSRGELESNRLLNLSLARLLEIIGEAATRVPQSERDKHPDIEWGDIIGMRNRLIHGYDLLDQDAIWDAATDDLPRLIAALKKVPWLANLG